jgi:hypothetical protein
MLKIYQVTLSQENECDLQITYSDSFKSMSDDEIATALEDCITSLQIQLMLLTAKP